jgi:ubiquinone biosynthesis protein COQ9
LLAKVYLLTFIYWCRDTSPEKHKTWLFLEKRIADVLKLASLKKLPSEILPWLKTTASFLFKKLSERF